MASWHHRLGAILVVAAATLAGTGDGGATPVRVGSKSFTESYLIAEIVARIAEQVGEAPVERRFGLGGTGMVYGALAGGEIDLYPEYTGTISRAILKDSSVTTVPALRARIRPRGLIISDPLGFANTYALAVRRDTAARLGLRRISDLDRHPGLTAAFDPGFLDRDDGWPGLQHHYGLRLAAVRGMEHALTYPALISGRVDVIDVFSTDGQLARTDLVVLTDDRRFFPDYAAALLARASLAARLPRTWAALQQRLGGRIDNATMARLNAEVELDRRTFAQAAAAFLGEREAADAGTARRRLGRDLATRTGGHQDRRRAHGGDRYAGGVHRRRRLRYAHRHRTGAQRCADDPGWRDPGGADGPRDPRRLRGARPSGGAATASWIARQSAIASSA